MTVRDPEIYDEDFYTWALKQAQLLREGRLSEIAFGQILNAALASMACSRPQPKRRSEIVLGGPVTGPSVLFCLTKKRAFIFPILEQWTGNGK
jgi:uncharacterized protein DUF29